ncbi:hypothetical protein AB0L05_30830 [Nonomuraea pusilla]|uniref:hypothetical protein n=1 Tax=Nonomuraea pusilla TaxID=46177 RepID=UPI0033209F26
MTTEQPQRPPATAPPNDGRAAGERSGAAYPGDVHWYDLPDDETELDADANADVDGDGDGEPGDLSDGSPRGPAPSRR